METESTLLRTVDRLGHQINPSTVATEYIHTTSISKWLIRTMEYY